jgi:hypothetical protein
MSRFIENYRKNELSFEFLISTDWDVIVLNKKVNAEKISQWYQEVDTRLNYLGFNFVKNKGLAKPFDKNNESETVHITGARNKGVHDYSKADHSLLTSYNMNWIIQKDVAIPPVWAADPDVFPELKPYMNDEKQIIKDFDHRSFVHLNQYLFGEYKNLFDEWGHKFLHNVKIQKHHPGMVLPLHTDHMAARLHMPLTIDNGRFYWGENWANEYKFTLGNIYLINTRVLHGTTNYGPAYRSNLISNVEQNQILDLVNL